MLFKLVTLLVIARKNRALDNECQWKGQEADRDLRPCPPTTWWSRVDGYLARICPRYLASSWVTKNATSID